MKTHHKFAPLRSVGVLTLSVMALGSAAADAHQPHSASSTVTRTGAAGNSATRQSSIATNGQGSYTAGSTVTGSNGKSASESRVISVPAKTSAPATGG